MDSLMVILYAAFGLLFHQTSLAADARSPSCVCRPLQRQVCGSDDVTYTNPCEAACAGTSVRSYGRCEELVDRPDANRGRPLRRHVLNDLAPERSEEWDLIQRRHLAFRCSTCESGERYVCGDDGHTYANAHCALTCGGVSVAYEGQCRPKLGASRYRPACNCPTTSWPVCGKDGSTYSHPCRALCRNVAVASDGPCELEAIQLIRRRILGNWRRRR